MLRHVLIIVVLIGAATVGEAAAQQRPLEAAPFSHSPCSVLDGAPCTPSYCGVFNDGPCVPEIDYPYGQNLQLTIQSVPPEKDAEKYRKPDHDLDSIGDLFAALRSCWTPPAADNSREGMQMSVRFSFKRSGEIIAKPQLTFATAGVPAETRTTYLTAINDSLNACMPLKLSAELGGSIAGRPIAIRYVDNRDLGKASEKR